MAAGLLAFSATGVEPASAQTAPPTLTGEELIATGPGGGLFNCGNTGSFSFTASGTATGPYSGTFTETGSGTVLSPYTLSSFTATFTISSAAAQVTGTKTLTSPTPGGVCYQDSSDFSVGVDTSYQATIRTSGGNYTDQGTASTDLFEPGNAPFLDEPFTSSQAQPTLIEPTSKDQCKNGGWKNFPQFQNQGQCVAYVEHSQGGS